MFLLPVQFNYWKLLMLSMVSELILCQKSNFTAAVLFPARVSRSPRLWRSRSAMQRPSCHFSPSWVSSRTPFRWSRRTTPPRPSAPSAPASCYRTPPTLSWRCTTAEEATSGCSHCSTRSPWPSPVCLTRTCHVIKMSESTTGICSVGVTLRLNASCSEKHLNFRQGEALRKEGHWLAFYGTPASVP